MQALPISEGFGAGIHNTLEAAAYGVPVFFGPNYHRFREAREMIETGVAFSVEDSARFTPEVISLLSDNERLKSLASQAGQYVAKRTGAT